MIGKPATPAAYDLIHRGALALADVEAWGMRIDVDYVKRAMRKCEQRIKQLEERMRNDDIYRLWQRRYGASTNISSRPQLASILYDELGYEPKSFTDKGNRKADREALDGIDIPLVRWYDETEQVRMLRNRYLRNILRETIDGLARPFFNLHTTITYRSSADKFSFQNLPIRDPKLGKTIRRAFIAREGHRLVEIDFGQQEVRVAGCCCKDKKLIEDTVSGDMHLDMASECFLLDKDDVSKDARNTTKGGFVFAQFYGDWYKQCAQNLWQRIDDIKDPMQTKGGRLVKEHLEEHGIVELGECNPKKDPEDGTFEKHLQSVERSFWDDRYSTYNQWRIDFYNRYKRRGWFRMITGFVCKGNAGKGGFYSKNDVINAPIQGPAFHCLLWSLIRLVQHIKRNKMRSRVVGQIHDSMLIDAHEDELDELLVVANKIMTQDIVEAWPWLIVPLVIEAEVAPAGGNWFEKEDYPIPC